MENKLDLTDFSAKVEKVKEQFSGEIRNIGSKEVGETPEEKAQRVQELNDKIQETAKKRARFEEIKKFKTYLLQVKSELDKGKTMDDILQEISEKKSSLSRVGRDFCLSFEKDAIESLLKDMEDFANGKIKI